MNYLKIALPIGAVLLLAVVILLWRDARSDNAVLKERLIVKTQEVERISKRNEDLEREAWERLADETAINKMERNLTNAIDDLPVAEQSATPSAAVVVLGCLRLRQAGATASDSFKRLCNAGSGIAGAKAPAK